MTQSLKIFAVGFTPIEQRLLQGTVALSARREPKLELMPATAADQAEAIIVDTQDAEARMWVTNNPWIHERNVVWVDSVKPASEGHAVVARPVQWTSLPILLARVMDEDTRHAPAPEAGLVAEDDQPDASPAVIQEDAAKAILIVDDSRAVRDHLNAYFARLGLEVDQAPDGETAIQMAQQRNYGCILMDVLMPGINGYDACRDIKANARSRNQAIAPNVVMLTSKSSPFDRIRGKMAGCDAYLTKPVDAGLLTSTLQKFMTIEPQGASSSGQLSAPPQWRGASAHG